MRTILALLLFMAPCGAQDIGTKDIGIFSTGKVNVITPPSVMALIDSAGNVTIDWKAVERAAAGPMDQSGQYARLMLAIRDKTYKSFEDQK